VPTHGGSELPMLRAYGGDSGASRGNPIAFGVAAGTEYTAKVEMPWGFNGSRSFDVKTWMGVP
jgi:hypothetical protein